MSIVKIDTAPENQVLYLRVFPFELNSKKFTPTRKIAIIYYRMVRYKDDFTPYDYDQYKEKFRLAKIASLEKVLNLLTNDAA